jgi:lipopolysaccharide transport system permease protein
VIWVAWALIRPLTTMIVFTVVFGKIAKLPLEGMRALEFFLRVGLSTFRKTEQSIADLI